MAFTLDICQPGSDGVHQRTPEWLLAFVPFLRRDTKNGSRPDSVEDAVAMQAPIVVAGDCVALNTSESKGTPAGSLQAVLRGGNINYAAAVAPGDYVFAWMSSDPDVIRMDERAARAGRQCNGWNSGLKFFGRVSSVRERLTADPASGVKQLVYTVAANSFQELTTQVYFNPVLFQGDRKTSFINDLSSMWINYVGPDGMSNSQDLVKLFLNIFMGTGPQGRAKYMGDMMKTPNAALVVPMAVAAMLGRHRSKEKPTHKYTDILDVIMGVQKYSSPATGGGENPWARLQPDMPSGHARLRQKVLARKVSGSNVAIPDVFASNPVWSILKSYSNEVVNELFTATRTDGEGSIVPTLVHRQIPFTTPEYINRLSGRAKPLPGKLVAQTAAARRFTSFFELPRWRPDPGSVCDSDLGRTDAARINFVQIWGTSNAIERANASQADQVTRGNYFQDGNDIRRSGLRPRIATSYFDFFAPASDGSNAPVWTQWCADWVVNGNLKTNGSVTMLGVDEPIAIGDNFEWLGVVYHIEQVTHTCQISADGTRSFRTTVSLSNGLDARSDESTITVYPWMDKPYRENITAEDDATERVLPGYTDVQDAQGRAGGELGAARADVDLNRVPPPARRRPAPAKAKPSASKAAAPKRDPWVLSIDFDVHDPANKGRKGSGG